MADSTPRPAALHIAGGNKSKIGSSKLGKEFKPKAEVPKCPSGLGRHGRRMYKHITGELDKYGLCTAFDIVALEVYCDTYERWQTAKEKLGKDDSDAAIVKGGNGQPTISPWFMVATKEREALLKMAREFGFTPAARASLRNDPSAGSADEPDGKGGNGWGSF